MAQTLDSQFSHTWTTMTPEDLEKFATHFADLIIKDCAAEADQQTIYCRGIPWGRWIREHFGVE